MFFWLFDLHHPKRAFLYPDRFMNCCFFLSTQIAPNKLNQKKLPNFAPQVEIEEVGLEHLSAILDFFDGSCVLCDEV